MVTVKEVAEAERLCRQQRMMLARLVEIDVTKGGDPEALVKFRTAAHRAHESDEALNEFDRLLARPKSSRLLNAGAIYFRRAA